MESDTRTAWICEHCEADNPAEIFRCEACDRTRPRYDQSEVTFSRTLTVAAESHVQPTVSTTPATTTISDGSVPSGRTPSPKETTSSTPSAKIVPADHSVFGSLISRSVAVVKMAVEVLAISLIGVITLFLLLTMLSASCSNDGHSPKSINQTSSKYSQKSYSSNEKANSENIRTTSKSNSTKIDDLKNDRKDSANETAVSNNDSRERLEIERKHRLERRKIRDERRRAAKQRQLQEEKRILEEQRLKEEKIRQELARREEEVRLEKKQKAEAQKRIILENINSRGYARNTTRCFFEHLERPITDNLLHDDRACTSNYKWIIECATKLKTPSYMWVCTPLSEQVFKFSIDDRKYIHQRIQNGYKGYGEMIDSPCKCRLKNKDGNVAREPSCASEYSRLEPCDDMTQNICGLSIRTMTRKKRYTSYCL